MRAVPLHPALKRPTQHAGTGPLLQPEALAFEGAHGSLPGNLPLRVVRAAKHRPDSQRAAGPHESQRGTLPPAPLHLAALKELRAAQAVSIPVNLLVLKL